MKNILAENMLRFGVKNLNETATKRVKILAEQQQKTATAQTITIKSASEYQYKVTPSVDLIFRSSDILKIDFVANTLKLGKVVYNIGNIATNQLQFGIVKNLIIAHGGPKNPESNDAWKTYIPIAMNAITLFSTDKNIPDNIRKQFAECKNVLKSIGSRTGTLAELVNNWNKNNMAGFGIDNEGLDFNVDVDQAKAIYGNLQQIANSI